jgi:hypothetical protein
LNPAVLICVDVIERLVAELLRDRHAQLVLLEELDQEHAKFSAVEVTILVGVKFYEVQLNLILQILWSVSVALELSNGSEKLSLFELLRVDHLVVIKHKSLQFSEVSVGVEQDFEVFRLHFPSDLRGVLEALAIHRDAVTFFRIVASAFYCDLFASHVGRVLLVDLGALALGCFTDYRTQAEVPGHCWVVDPGKINEAVVQSRMWVDDGTSAKVLAVAHHNHASVEWGVFIAFRLLWFNLLLIYEAFK